MLVRRRGQDPVSDPRLIQNLVPPRGSGREDDDLLRVTTVGPQKVVTRGEAALLFAALAKLAGNS